MYKRKIITINPNPMTYLFVDKPAIFVGICLKNLIPFNIKLKNMDCLFCKIIAGEIPSHKIYEDDKTFAFLDISPISEGHTLVVPKNHFQYVEEMDEGDASAVFLSTIKISKQIREKMNRPATTLGIHNGRESGQEIPHVHVHIIPREESDGGGPINIVLVNGKMDRPTDNELKTLAERLHF